MKPYMALRSTFKEVYNPTTLDTDAVGGMLRELSIELGRAAAQLDSRGVPWEVIERNIKTWMTKGVALEAELDKALREEFGDGEEAEDEGHCVHPAR